jgi:SAM-dependent methyltransferase
MNAQFSTLLENSRHLAGLRDVTTQRTRDAVRLSVIACFVLLCIKIRFCRGTRPCCTLHRNRALWESLGIQAPPIDQLISHRNRATCAWTFKKSSLPSNSVDVVIANYVLEHVDDRAALCELNRILAPRGRLITTVPIIEAWERTYENPQITREADRARHFVQEDHVRHYGRDFRDRVKSLGFSLSEFQADGPSTARYGLIRGECVFIASKNEKLSGR